MSRIKIKFNDFINENLYNFNTLYHGTDKESANDISINGVDITKSDGGYFGWGFYTTPDIDLAKSNYADFADTDEGGVILEFQLEKNANILDLRNPEDYEIWKKYARKIYDKNLYKTLIKDNIDGLFDNSFDGVVIYNPKVLKFKKIHSEFIIEKHEVTKLYHGSKYLFDMFDDSKISSGDGSELFGKGYYLTDNIEVANFYAELITKKDKIEKYDFSGPLKSEVPIYSKDADIYAKANKKINKFLLNGNILDTYTYILDSDFVNKLLEIYTKYSGWGVDESKRLFNTKMEFLRKNKAGINRYRGELLYIIQSVILSDKDMMNELVEYIKSLGYDGVKYKPDTSFEGNIDSYNYVIYNKNVLKSL